MFGFRIATYISLAVILGMGILPTAADAQSTGKIRGRVIGASSGAPLPGANVIVSNTSQGAATDTDGEFVITGVPVGTHTLTVTYIGYETMTETVEVTESAIASVELEMTKKTLEGEAVTVTGQAKGQTEAINQQIAANSIKNVVSATKIRELPEANAAEAVGRLPGISLKREGGEGNKVVIRGLSPEYNQIKIGGVSMAATDTSNRSVDLSMISPYMLAGIEVSKTAMADEEADQLGGSVNFELKSASEGTSFNFMAQGGYSGLRREIGNYHYVASGGKRFFDGRFGVFAEGDIERRDRSDNNVYAGYQMLRDTLTIANSLGFQDISRVNQRRGGVLVMDYQTPTTSAKLSNMYSGINVDTYRRQEHLNAAGRTHSYNGVYHQENMNILVNSLRLEHYFGNVLVDGGLNYSRSETEVPEELSIEASESNAFQRNWTYDDAQIQPEMIANKAINDTSRIYLNWLEQRDYQVLEDEYSGDLNIIWGYDLGVADLEFKVGGQYKHKSKEYDNEEFRVPMGWNDLDLVRTYLADEFNLTNYDAAQDFPYRPFIDDNYDPGNFMAGDYTIRRIPDVDKLIRYYHAIEDLEAVRGQQVGKTVYRNYNASIQNDYYGHEDYLAGYIMPTIDFRGIFTMIPGIRYEKNTTQYTAYRANSPGRWSDPFQMDTATATRENEFILPMIHGKVKLSDWSDLRFSYTQTLSRPSYRRIIPTWTTWENNLTWNNTSLKPAESRNYDVFLSFYGDRMGLFTLGGFQKRIKNFIYNTTTWIADSSYLQPEWPETVQPGGKVFGYINNPNTANLYGLELEWQSNFWYLPRGLQGLVLNANYTYTHSRLRYPRQEAKWDTVQIGPVKIPKVVGMKDAGYEARLLDQPTHILNLTVGYDYRGFSFRVSMQYKSDVFIANNWYRQLRQATEPLTLYDMKIQQRLPVRGLQVFCNVNNLSRAIEQSSNNGTNWFTSRSYYGLSMDLGLKYEF